MDMICSINMINLVWGALVPAVHLMDVPDLVAHLTDCPWLLRSDDASIANLGDTNHPHG